MSRRRTITIVISLVVPIFAYYYIRSLDISFNQFWNIENLVGIVAILSGATGVVMGIASSRQASLDAVKEYFQQGDDLEHVNARRYIAEKKHLKGDIYSVEVSQTVNFFQLWGLLNRKRYLPIWVFGGASGVRVVELYINVSKIIDKKRESNPYYAQEFEYLSYRIYRQYKENFSGSNLEKEYKDEFANFKKSSKKWWKSWFLN